MNGVLNIYKESGISSASVVGKVKRILGTRAVGHMGTLDPIGEGVLLMGVGKGTRLFDYYLRKTKTYEAIFRFGESADSDDICGTVTGRTDVLPTVEDVLSALPLFTGEMEQLPPLYSAKSVDGVRAYKLAREGKTPILKKSRICVNSFRLLEKINDTDYKFEIDCSAGTYIRSLCRDLALSLGSLGIMTAIKRTRCGKYFSNDSVRIEDLTENDVIPLSVALADLPRFDADDGLYKKLLSGIRPIVQNTPDGDFALYCKNELFGIAHYDGGLKIKTFLKEDEI